MTGTIRMTSTNCRGNFNYPNTYTPRTTSGARRDTILPIKLKPLATVHTHRQRRPLTVSVYCNPTKKHTNKSVLSHPAMQRTVIGQDQSRF